MMAYGWWVRVVTERERAELTFTTRGLVTCRESEVNFNRPPNQNHHFTLSFMAQTRLGLFFPVFVLHSSSSSFLRPLNVHHTTLKPGVISPAANRILYSFASFALRSYDAFILSAILAAARLSWSLYKSVASSGLAYPNPRRPVIQSNVKSEKNEAVASGISSESSRDVFGGAGGFVDVNGTRCHLCINVVIQEIKCLALEHRKRRQNDVPSTLVYSDSLFLIFCVMLGILDRTSALIAFRHVPRERERTKKSQQGKERH